MSLQHHNQSSNYHTRVMWQAGLQTACSWPVCEIHICTVLPGQAPMSAHSSNIKNCGWAVAQRKCPIGSTIPAQTPTLDKKLPARVWCTESTCIIASPVLCRSQLNGRERCIVIESGLTHRLVAKLQQYSSLVVCKFRTAGEEHCE